MKAVIFLIFLGLNSIHAAPTPAGFDFMGDIAKSFADVFAEATKAATKFLELGTSLAGNTAKAGAGVATGAIRDIGGAAGQLTKNVEQLTQQVAGVASNAVSTGTGLAMKGVDTAISAAGSATDFANQGLLAAGGLVNGAADIAGQVVKTATGLAGGVVNGLTQSAGAATNLASQTMG